MTLDAWFRIQNDISRVVSPALVILFHISWIWIGAFIFKNIFVGVMGASRAGQKACPVTHSCGVQLNTLK
jgi:hypothetical protein